MNIFAYKTKKEEDITIDIIAQLQASDNTRILCLFDWWIEG